METNENAEVKKNSKFVEFIKKHPCEVGGILGILLGMTFSHIYNNGYDKGRQAGYKEGYWKGRGGYYDKKECN